MYQLRRLAVNGCPSTAVVDIVKVRRESLEKHVVSLGNPNEVEQATNEWIKGHQSTEMMKAVAAINEIEEQILSHVRERNFKEAINVIRILEGWHRAALEQQGVESEVEADI